MHEKRHALLKARFYFLVTTSCSFMSFPYLHRELVRSDQVKLGKGPVQNQDWITFQGPYKSVRQMLMRDKAYRVPVSNTIEILAGKEGGSNGELDSTCLLSTRVTTILLQLIAGIGVQGR